MKLRNLTATHAGRIVLAAIPVAVVATVLMGGVANGAVPVSFAVSGSQFQISASQLDGTVSRSMRASPTTPPVSRTRWPLPTSLRPTWPTSASRW